MKQRTNISRILLSFLSVLLCLTLLVSCSAAPGEEAPDGGFLGGGSNGGVNMNPSEGVFDENQSIMEAPEGFRENDFVSAEDHPVSTFSSDVDTASYAYFRKLVSQGLNFDTIRERYGTNIRTEEMLNYFSYRYTAPNEGEPFGVYTEIAPCPWNSENALLMLNLTAEIAEENEVGNNLVFLIDVSGSMYSQDKLPLLKTAFTYLVERLTDKDRVSIVTYSGKEEVILEGCKGSDSETILAAINRLEASGSTNGQAGLQTAYRIAESCKLENGNNRIIMASDGDLNVGISSATELREYIATKRDTGIFLSVLGFGTGNYKDVEMEALADNGNGVYYYIDCETEAERIFGEGLFSTLYTVAKDVKLQLTFDPSQVDSYRLIGYENRLLSEEDFENDEKDAGDVGSGHSLTVCYELVLTENASTETKDTTVPLSAFLPLTGKELPHSDGSEKAWFTLEIRAKKPDSDTSELYEYTFGGASYTENPSTEFRFASAVIEAAMLLHDSEYIGDITLDDVIAELEKTSFTDDKKNEFVALLKKSKG